MFTLIFVTLFLSVWAACGAAVWLVASVATRGEAGLSTLLLALLAAPLGGLAVPLLVRDDGVGLWLSAVAAVALSVLVVGTRTLARHAPASDHQPTEDVEVGL